MSSPGSAFRLAVCADTFFLDLPFLDRVREIARAGFEVEFWTWRDRPIDTLARDGTVPVAACNGYLGGSLVHPDGAEAYLDGVRKSIPIARTLGCRELFLTTGEFDSRGTVIHPVAADPAVRAITAYRVLSKIAELAEKHDLLYSLENLNTKVDHPGYALPTVQDVLNLVQAVGSPRVRVLFDIYHAQVQEGNIVELTRRLAPNLGHVQVADVPGRHEPGTGEINYPAIVAALREIGYAGVVGLEAFAEGSPHRAMETFRMVFSARAAAG